MRTTISVNRVTSSQPGSAVAIRYATLCCSDCCIAMRCGAVRRGWQFDLDSAGTKTFHVKRVKGSVDSTHTLDRDEVAGLRKLAACRS